ncbi:MAG: chromosomal replication initiator protein DnaA [Acidobacteria bacterium]|nr:chromosomal replication initiator protein DnaA [Acidobacteriota bacterium]
MDIWDTIKQELSNRIPAESFNEWFADTYQISNENGKISVHVPEPYFSDFITRYYNDFIKQIQDELKIDMDLEFTSETEQQAENKVKESNAVPVTGKTQIKKKSFFQKPRFNPNYTFSNFVVGPTNELAYATSMAVTENPGYTYNPLFIYGGTGLGKTHLLHAIGHKLLIEQPELKILFLSAEKFMNDYIVAVRTKKMDEFRMKYRNCDIFLVDDIHTLAGKTGTQEEFFNTFNELFDRQKQIVLSSDSLPKDISRLEERLMTRFSWGIIADIQPPELEVRIAILQKKAEKQHIQLPNEIALLIAKKVRKNVRELEGALNKVIAVAKLNDKKITPALVKKSLQVYSNDNETITPEMIIQYVSDFYKLTPNKLKEKNNAASIVLPRQIAMFLCKTLTPLSYPQIGRAFGKKHHTTVLYAVEKIRKKIKDDPKFSRLIDSFKISIK